MMAIESVVQHLGSKSHIDVHWVIRPYHFHDFWSIGILVSPLICLAFHLKLLLMCSIPRQEEMGGLTALLLM